MARCNGGQNQKGERKSGRMHMDGDEPRCTKHQSDNFSTLSTISRAATRYLQLQAAQPYPQVEDEVEDEIETDGPEDGPSVISGSASPPRSPGPLFNTTNSVFERSHSPGSTVDSTAPLLKNDVLVNAAPNPILVGPGFQQMLGVHKDSNRPASVHQTRNKPDRSPAAALLFLLTIGMYGWYRYIFRGAFQYQEDVTRDHFGLPKRSGYMY